MVLTPSSSRRLAGLIAAYHVVLGVGSLVLYAVGGLGGLEVLAWIGGALVPMLWPLFLLGPIIRMAGVIGGLALHGGASFARTVLAVVSLLDAIATSVIGLMLTLVGGVALGAAAFAVSGFSVAAAAIVLSGRGPSGSKETQDLVWRLRREARARRQKPPPVKEEISTAELVEPPPGETPSFRILEVVPLFDRPRSWWSRAEPEEVSVPASVRACGLALVGSALFGFFFSATALQSVGGPDRSSGGSSYHTPFPDMTPEVEIFGLAAAASAIAGVAVFSLVAGMMCLVASPPPYALGMAAGVTVLMTTAWLLKISNLVESIQLTLLQIVNLVVFVTLLIQKRRGG